MDSTNPDQGQSVFSQEPTAPQAVTPASQPVVPAPAPVLPTEVAALVGVGKKYATAEEALRSVPHAQAHIDTIQAELAQSKIDNAAMAEELTKRQTAEEVISQMQQHVNAPAATPQTLDQAEIMKAAKQAAVEEVRATSLQDKYTANEAAVSSKMKELYGDKTTDVIRDKAIELNVDPSYLQQTAQSNPTLFYNIMGIKDTTPTPKRTQASNMTSIEGTVAQGNHQPAPKKSVLAGATSAELVNEWKRCGENIEN